MTTTTVRLDRPTLPAIADEIRDAGFAYARACFEQGLDSRDSAAQKAAEDALTAFVHALRPLYEA